MGNEQKWEVKTATSRPRDESRRFAAVYLNSPIPLTLGDRIDHGWDIPGGELSFTDGVLCYSYEAMRFHLSADRLPSSLKVQSVVCLDPEFMTHEWLVEMYPAILRHMKSCDPFHLPPTHAYAHAVKEWRVAPPGRVTALFKDDLALPIVCWVNVASGGKIYVAGRIEYAERDVDGTQSFVMRLNDLHVED